MSFFDSNKNVDNILDENIKNEKKTASEASLKALCAIKEIPVQWKRVSKNPSKERLILAGEVCPMKMAYNKLTCEQQNILRDGVVLISAVEDLHRVCIDATEFMKEGFDPRSAHYLLGKYNPYYSNGYARVSLKFRREDGLFGSVTFTPYYELAFNVKSEPANKFEFDNLDAAMAEFHTIVYGGVGRPPYFSDRLQVKCKKNRLFRGDGGLKIPSTPVFIRLSDI